MCGWRRESARDQWPARCQGRSEGIVKNVRGLSRWLAALVCGAVLAVLLASPSDVSAEWEWWDGTTPVNASLRWTKQ